MIGFLYLVKYNQITSWFNFTIYVQRKISDYGSGIEFLLEKVIKGRIFLKIEIRDIVILFISELLKCVGLSNLTRTSQ